MGTRRIKGVRIHSCFMANKTIAIIALKHIKYDALQVLINIFQMLLAPQYPDDEIRGYRNSPARMHDVGPSKGATTTR